MQTITDAIGSGSIHESPIQDIYGPIPGWATREPVKPPRKRTVITANLGFISNCYPRSDGSGLGAALPLGDPIPTPANENVAGHRWPVWEEFVAGRLGATKFENEIAWQQIEFIADTWNSFAADVEPYFSPGTARISGDKTDPGLGDLSALRGPEQVAHFHGVWRYIDRKTNGGFGIVKKVIVIGAEMRDLALDIANKAKRAAVGRSRFIGALPVVAEEVKLLAQSEAL